ncbi:hypothetical protein SAMN04488090_1777 [Siphonobacter aquaeclarae]|uniref:Uncharacterized protein n=2 Tax=Siphonobacter aquaeclarae TaxID=563176 RepID=A0A1G9MWT5_9BACT|nr:hypothetical protein SAMN04488090_1777 [Siphonobacter aquaeclarae]
MKDLKIWEFELRTESDMDNWIIHYGFTYIPSILMRNSQYFSEADANGGYVVRKMSNKPENEWRNGSPTVSFTHPFNKVYRKDMFGMSIVTGTNFSTYNAGLGLSYIRGYNGLFTAGVMYTQKDALNGQYKDGSVLKENLNFDQLHYKKGGIEFFFSLSLRLDKNPFAEIPEKK